MDADVALTSRDHELLTWLGRHGEVSTSQFTRRFYRCERVARRQLAKLRDLGYLSARPRPSVSTGRPQQLWQLTKLGAEVIGREDLTGRCDSGYAVTEHRLACGEVILCLELAAVQHGYACRWLSEAECRRRCRDEGLRPIPDGVVTLADKDSGKATLLMVEADLGTEPLRRNGEGTSLARKLEDYREAVRSHRFLVPEGQEASRYRGFRVLFVTTSETRLAAVQGLLAERPQIADLVWLTTLAELGDVLGPVWRRGTSTQRSSLVSPKLRPEPDPVKDAAEPPEPMETTTVSALTGA